MTLPDDLVVAPHQFAVRTLLHGPGSPNGIETARDGWTGLGVPDPNTRDMDIPGSDEAFLGADYGGPRPLTFPVWWRASSEADAMLILLDVNAAWARSRVNLSLVFMLPGWGRCRVTGKPRGFDADLAEVKSGMISGVAKFVASSQRIDFLPDPPP